MSGVELPAHPIETEQLAEQPEKTMRWACGIAFFGVVLKNGTVIPQHQHDHDHATHIGSGRVRLWVNGKWRGDHEAGDALELKAGDLHIFQALEDNTRITCVWPESNVSRYEVGA